MIKRMTAWLSPAQAAVLPQRAHLAAVDEWLAVCVGVLIVLGAVMVYSASIALPDAPRFARYTPTHFLVRHVLFICVGLAAAVIVFRVPMAVWQRHAPVLFLAGIALLVLVLIPGIGKNVNGANRWIPLPVFNFQPSEVMKLFIIL
ncbi:MAG: FtsW/RodA/SpoVE family cell cycle protein, partial [Burkholderiaceae bacterium]